jgi:hypothetical protein
MASHPVDYEVTTRISISNDGRASMTEVKAALEANPTLYRAVMAYNCLHDDGDDGARVRASVIFTALFHIKVRNERAMKYSVSPYTAREVLDMLESGMRGNLNVEFV